MAAPYHRIFQRQHKVNVMMPLDAGVAQAATRAGLPWLEVMLLPLALCLNRVSADEMQPRSHVRQTHD